MFKIISTTNSLLFVDRLVYLENFTMGLTTKQIQRNSYNIFDVFSDIGGLIQTFMVVTAIMLRPYCKQAFQIYAI